MVIYMVLYKSYRHQQYRKIHIYVYIGSYTGSKKGSNEIRIYEIEFGSLGYFFVSATFVSSTLNTISALDTSSTLNTISALDTSSTLNIISALDTSFTLDIISALINIINMGKRRSVRKKWGKKQES